MSPFFAHAPKTTSSSSSITQGGGGERRNQSIEREFFFASFPPLSPPATATDNFSGPLPTSAPTSPPSSGPPLAVVVVGQVVLRSAHYSLSLFHFPHCCIFVPPFSLPIVLCSTRMAFTHLFGPLRNRKRTKWVSSILGDLASPFPPTASCRGGTTMSAADPTHVLY